MIGNILVLVLFGTLQKPIKGTHLFVRKPAIGKVILSIKRQNVNKEVLEHTSLLTSNFKRLLQCALVPFI